MKVITAPDKYILDENDISVFLAGGITNCPDWQSKIIKDLLHIKSDKKVEKRLIDYCLESVVDVFEDTGLTVDVQPVKRSEWEKKSSVGVFRCSLCQHIFMLGTDEIDEYHFCPHCGADMRNDSNLMKNRS